MKILSKHPFCKGTFYTKVSNPPMLKYPHTTASQSKNHPKRSLQIPSSRLEGNSWQQKRNQTSKRDTLKKTSNNHKQKRKGRKSRQFEILCSYFCSSFFAFLSFCSMKFITKEKRNMGSPCSFSTPKNKANANRCVTLMDF